MTSRLFRPSFSSVPYFLTGTSLNGLGKKYAIVDYLKEEDVIEIVKEFERNKLI